MTDRASMQPLLNVLNARDDSSHPVQLWLRDDDAVEPTQPLKNLLELTDRFAIPLTLAVIPAFSGQPLAALLALPEYRERVMVAVHGWSHQNYAPADEKKQELGLHRPLCDIVAELGRGYTDLVERHGRQCIPLLVPPWNRIDPELIQALPRIGFRGISSSGNQTSEALPMMNARVDVIDWKGSRGGRSTSELVAKIVALINSTDAPIGILTHHLVHDQQVWDFLEQLFTATAEHRAVRWAAIDSLIPGLTPNP